MRPQKYLVGLFFGFQVERDTWIFIHKHEYNCKILKWHLQFSAGFRKERVFLGLEADPRFGESDLPLALAHKGPDIGAIVVAVQHGKHSILQEMWGEFC
jgi:hypothetical protein